MVNKLLSSLYSWIIMVIVVIVVITANSFYVVKTLDDLSSLEARLFTTNRVTVSYTHLTLPTKRIV